jgi:thioredoxin reductase
VMGDRVDAVVAGGGPAGLNAALVLVRARRSVVICDDGAPRNQASHAMHNYLSRDGMDPAELLRAGRDEISRYPGARFLRCTVDDVQRAGDGFRATASTGEVIEARKVLLAVGIKDWLPPIAGFDEMYGRSVFHCQYCDGWSARDLPLAVLSEGPGGFRQALMMLGWTRDVALCTQGPAGLTVDQRAALEAQAIPVCEQPVVRFDGSDGQLERLLFADGSSLGRRVLFFHGDQALSSNLPVRIGCRLTSQRRIEVDEGHRTSVDGVFAAGDGARRPGQHPSTQVILAAASGALAGIALHQELMHEDFGLTPALPRAVAG